MLGQTAQLPGYVGQHIHCGGASQPGVIDMQHTCKLTQTVMCVSVFTRVGDHNESAVGAVLDDLGDDGLEDVDVPLHQVEAALSFLLANTGRHHDQTRVGCHCVVWRRRTECETRLSHCHVQCSFM